MLDNQNISINFELVVIYQSFLIFTALHVVIGLLLVDCTMYIRELSEKSADLS